MAARDRDDDYYVLANYTLRASPKSWAECAVWVYREEHGRDGFRPDDSPGSPLRAVFEGLSAETGSIRLRESNCQQSCIDIK